MNLRYEEIEKVKKDIFCFYKDYLVLIDQTEKSLFDWFSYYEKALKDSVFFQQLEILGETKHEWMKILREQTEQEGCVAEFIIDDKKPNVFYLTHLMYQDYSPTLQDFTGGMALQNIKDLNCLFNVVFRQNLSFFQKGLFQENLIDYEELLQPTIEDGLIILGEMSNFLEDNNRIETVLESFSKEQRVEIKKIEQ